MTIARLGSDVRRRSLFEVLGKRLTKRGNTLSGTPRIPYGLTVQDLAELTLLSPGLLYRLYKSPESFYRPMAVPKRSGGTRKVYCPFSPMRAIQYWILNNILLQVPTDPAATAFVRNRSLLDNVRPHRNRTFLVSIDLQDFFGSITYRQVYYVFRDAGYGAQASSLLTRICTLDGSLPQGAITSPTISNLVMVGLDRRVSGYCGPRDVTYTRYADDITLSADDMRALVHCCVITSHMLRGEGFSINPRKTRWMGKKAREPITGLMISRDGSVGISRNKKRELRQLVHRLKTDIAMPEDQRRTLVRRLSGWKAYLKGVDPVRYGQLTKYIDRLSLH